MTWPALSNSSDGEVWRLDDPRCGRVELAGGKAAGLAVALAAGIPVLPGFVVPASAATRSLAAGRAVLAERGSGGARRAVMAQPLTDDLLANLRSATSGLGGRLIVRSSADVEAGGEWSGAFSTFGDVGPEDLGVAVRGCWASVFALDALERAERTGVDTSVSMALLVQPHVAPRVAGLARVRGDEVDIDVVEGSAAALMDGWAEGQRVSVSAAGVVRLPPASLLTEAGAREVAAILTAVQGLLGHGVIEWLEADGAIALVQSGPTAPGRDAVDIVARMDQLNDPRADTVARLALAFPGGVCEELVFPWALGGTAAQVLAHRSRTRNPNEAREVDVAALRRDVQVLAGQVWRAAGVADPIEASRQLLRDLRGDRPADGLARLSSLDPADPARAADVLDRLWAVGARAVRRGLLSRPEDIFACESEEVLGGSLRGRPSGAGARRWEPFLAAVAQTRGVTVPGIAASPGIGAGRVRVVLDSRYPPEERGPREVIVTPLPVPGLAGLLWGAAGLVTLRGSPAAHLIEVARSLGVPAVVGCHLANLDRLDGLLLAVDGERGLVSRHDIPTTA